MASRLIEQTFEEYSKTRHRFAQTILDLSARPQNVKFLLNHQVLAQLRPLLIDPRANIQQIAALSLSNLASNSPQLAKQLTDDGTLQQLVAQTSQHSRQYKRASCCVVRAVARHSAVLAGRVVDSTDALTAVVACLEQFEPCVKEAAAWATGAIAQHSARLAERCVDAGCVPLLAVAVREPELRAKWAAVSALGDICRHSEQLALVVVESGAVRALCSLLTAADVKLRRVVVGTLGEVAQHSATTAELVVEADVLPDAFAGLQSSDMQLGVHTATLVKHLVRHSRELSQLVVNAGGAAALVDFLGRGGGVQPLPGVLALGFMAAHSAQLAMAVIVSRGVAQLAVCLQQGDCEQHVQAACVWALGQLGRHTPEHARAVAEAQLLPTLLHKYTDAKSSEDLRDKARQTLQSVLQMCVHVPALDPLLHEAPAVIVEYVVAQYSKILPHDPQARRQFVTSGCLRRVQTIVSDADSSLRDNINTINQCFPDEIVRFYSPEYTEQLLEKLDHFQPRVSVAGGAVVSGDDHATRPSNTVAASRTNSGKNA